MSINRLFSAVSALCATHLLPGCASTDPALRQAMSELDRRPESARVKLRPFAEQGNPVAIAQICIAHARSMDSTMRGLEREQAFAQRKTTAIADSVDSQYQLGNFYLGGGHSGRASERTQ